MAVAFDAVGPSSAGAGGTSISATSWAHVCSGTQRLLVVGIAVGDANDAGNTVTSVTYNSVPMTAVPSGLVHSNNSNGGYSQLFYLVNPSLGSNTVAVTIAVDPGPPAFLECGSISFTGVDQGSPFRNVTTGFGTATPASVTLASVIDNMVVDVVCCGFNLTTSNKTLRWLKNVGTSNAGGNGAQSTAAGASSVTMSYPVADWWGLVAMDIMAPISGNVRTSQGQLVPAV